MLFSRKRLHDNEELLLETRQHWSLLFFPTLVSLVVIGGVAAVLVIWTSAPGWFGWLLLAVGLITVSCFLLRLFTWRSTFLAVTSMRVVYRAGALRRIGREIPIASVQNVEYRQSIFERLLGKGHLTVESAGTHGSEPFKDIPHPEAVQGMINRAIDESHHREGTPPLRDASTPVPDEIERLADLHRRGVITDNEFARLKADLIDEHDSSQEHD